MLSGEQLRKASKEKRYIDIFVEPDFSIVEDNDNYTVAHIKTHKAACLCNSFAIGLSTCNWCIGYTREEGLFVWQDHSNRSWLILIHKKDYKPGQLKLLIEVRNSTILNVYDQKTKIIEYPIKLDLSSIKENRIETRPLTILEIFKLATGRKEFLRNQTKFSQLD
jgi:hypothetical protein